MEKKLYFECYSGISGDMAVAALLDLGADQKVLMDALNSLPVDGFEIKISRVKKSALDACDFDVVLDKEHENHDHDMEYLYGRGEDSREGHKHTHEEHVHVHEDKHMHEKHSHEEYEHMHEGHNHKEHDCEEHVHTHGHTYNEGTHTHEHAHIHRGFSDIAAIIQASSMTDHAKEIAIRIFEILAHAEAKAHGVPVADVHFHEVGAVDSIVDIAALAVCVDNLGITQAAASELYEGTGFVRCQHGIIPVPVPAVANIVAEHGICIHLTGDEGEFVTPTGAAIIAALKTQDLPPQSFQIEKIGLGAGKRKHSRSGILRAMLIHEV